jgi:hypothetical protein
MAKPQSRTIDGIEYTVAPIDPEEGLPVLLRLVKMLGAAMGESFKGSTRLADLMEKRLGGDIDVGAAVKELSAHLDDKTVLADVRTLLDGRYCSWRAAGDGGTLDMKHFQGEYGRLFKVLELALEVNYGRFLSGLKAALKGALQPGQDTDPKKKAKASTPAR